MAGNYFLQKLIPKSWRREQLPPQENKALLAQNNESNMQAYHIGNDELGDLADELSFAAGQVKRYMKKYPNVIQELLGGIDELQNACNPLMEATKIQSLWSSGNGFSYASSKLKYLDATLQRLNADEPMPGLIPKNEDVYDEYLRERAGTATWMLEKFSQFHDNYHEVFSDLHGYLTQLKSRLNEMHPSDDSKGEAVIKSQQCCERLLNMMQTVKPGLDILCHGNSFIGQSEIFDSYKKLNALSMLEHAVQFREREATTFKDMVTALEAMPPVKGYIDNLPYKKSIQIQYLKDFLEDLTNPESKFAFNPKGNLTKEEQVRLITGFRSVTKVVPLLREALHSMIEVDAIFQDEQEQETGISYPREDHAVISIIEDLNRIESIAAKMDGSLPKDSEFKYLENNTEIKQIGWGNRVRNGNLRPSSSPDKKNWL